MRLRLYYLIYHLDMALNCRLRPLCHFSQWLFVHWHDLVIADVERREG